MVTKRDAFLYGNSTVTIRAPTLFSTIFEYRYRDIGRKNIDLFRYFKNHEKLTILDTFTIFWLNFPKTNTEIFSWAANRLLLPIFNQNVKLNMTLLLIQKYRSILEKNIDIDEI